MELQPRDMAIMQFVFSSRVATLEQLGKRFFPERHKSAVARRLRQLCSMGFFRAGAILLDGRMQKVFFPESKCIGVVGNLWDFTIDKPQFKSESVSHDIRLGDLRFRLEKLTEYRDFISENLLSSSHELADSQVFGDFVKVHSDGALKLLGKDGLEYLFSIELELTDKGTPRYKEKLAAYYLTNSIEGVIYVCAEQGIIFSLKEADREVRGNRNSILYFGLEKNTIEAPNKIIFENAKEHSIEFI